MSLMGHRNISYEQLLTNHGSRNSDVDYKKLTVTCKLVKYYKIHKVFVEHLVFHARSMYGVSRKAND